MLNLQLLDLNRKERMDLIEHSNDFRSKYRVYFKIADFSSNEIHVKVWQLENNKHQYFTEEELQRTTIDLLTPYLKKGMTVEVEATAFVMQLDDKELQLRKAG